jgi:hypothetical protein
MKRITSADIERIEMYLAEHCRSLEVARFRFLLGVAAAGDVARELEAFRNPDGGFGHGLEPDFQLPDSSPMATSIAFQIMKSVKDVECESLVAQAVRFLEGTYRPERPGWQAVHSAVDDYPHAPWWTYDAATGGTPIDRSWGNPTAELIGYLVRHQRLVRELDPAALARTAVDRAKQLDVFDPHETYCFLRLFPELPKDLQLELVPPMNRAIIALVETDPAAWGSYVAKPLDFVKSPDSVFFALLEEAVEEHLDYVVDARNGDGVWEPTWEWGRYPDAWRTARLHWIGVLACENLAALQAFGRVE